MCPSTTKLKSSAALLLFMADELAELKKLPPEERLRRLKELEEKRRKEIEEAQKLAKSSEEELDKEKKFLEKVPIPQLIAEQMDTLTTEEEREMFRSQRFREKKEPESKETRHRRKPDKGEALEDVVRAERVRIDAAGANVDYMRAIQEASVRPVHDFYRELGTINRAAEERGYMTGEQASRAAYINAVVEQKEAASYTPTQEAAREMSLVHKIHEKLQSMYHSQAGKDAGESMSDLDRQRRNYRT